MILKTSLINNSHIYSSVNTQTESAFFEIAEIEVQTEIISSNEIEMQTDPVESGL